MVSVWGVCRGRNTCSQTVRANKKTLRNNGFWVAALKKPVYFKIMHGAISSKTTRSMPIHKENNSLTFSCQKLFLITDICGGNHALGHRESCLEISSQSRVGMVLSWPSRMPIWYNSNFWFLDGSYKRVTVQMVLIKQYFIFLQCFWKQLLGVLSNFNVRCLWAPKRHTPTSIWVWNPIV